MLRNLIQDRRNIHLLGTIDNFSNYNELISQTVISNCTKKTLIQGDRLIGQTDTISLDNFKVGDKVLVTPCGHSFLEVNLIPWLTRNNTCPLCRATI